MGIDRRHSLAWSFVVMLVGLAMVVAGCGGSGGSSSSSGSTGKIVLRLSPQGAITAKADAALGVDTSSSSSILGESGKVSLEIYNSNDNRDKLDLYSREQHSYTVDSQGAAEVESNPVLANRSYYVHTTVTPDGYEATYTSDLWVYVEPNTANVASPVVVPTPWPTDSPTPTPSPTDSPTPTPSPSDSPTPTPSPTGTPQDARLSFRASGSDYVAFYYQMGQHPTRGLLMDTEYDLAVEVLYSGETEYRSAPVSDFSLKADDPNLVTVKQDGDVWLAMTGSADASVSTSATLTYNGADTATWTKVIDDYISTEGHIDMGLNPKPSDCPTDIKLQIEKSGSSNKPKGASGELTIEHCTDESANFYYSLSVVDSAGNDISEDCGFSYGGLSGNLKVEDGFLCATSSTPSEGTFQLSSYDEWLPVLAYYLHLEGDNFDTFRVNIKDQGLPTINAYFADANAASIAAGTSQAQKGFDVTGGEEPYQFKLFMCSGDTSDPNSYTVLTSENTGEPLLTPDPQGSVSVYSSITGRDVWECSAEAGVVQVYQCTFTSYDPVTEYPIEATITLSVSPGV